MQAEFIALLLDEVDPVTAAGAVQELPWPSVLVRRADGRMAVESMSQHREAPRKVTTGVFRRGSPIVDPDTQEVMGYEMEEVDFSRSVAS